MAILHVRLASVRDAQVELRQEDREECEAYGLTSKEAIFLSIQNSILSYAIEVDGEVAALWGYGATSFTSNEATAWLLTTEVAGRYPKLFLQMSRSIVDKVLETYASVEVHVYKRYAKAIRWLDHIGFQPSREDDHPEFFYMKRIR